MRFAGIDIGSRTIELVVVDESGEIETSLQADTGFDPMAGARRLADGASFDRIMATGYGSERPVASNETPEGRAANRRVEILIRNP